MATEAGGDPSVNSAPQPADVPVGGTVSCEAAWKSRMPWACWGRKNSPSHLPGPLHCPPSAEMSLMHRNRISSSSEERQDLHHQFPRLPLCYQNFTTFKCSKIRSVQQTYVPWSLATCRLIFLCSLALRLLQPRQPQPLPLGGRLSPHPWASGSWWSLGSG